MSRANRSNMAIVINYSGGKDSTVMAFEICRRYPNIAKYIVYADTGFEHVLYQPAEDWCRKMASQFGHDLHVVKSSTKNYLTMVRARGMFPSSSTRQCTSDLKRSPIEKFIRTLPYKVILNATGMRAQESTGRAKRPRLKRNMTLCTRNRTVWNWNPILHWKLEDVLKLHADRGLPLHPVYQWAGGYLTRFSCRICIFSTDADIRAVYKHDREAFNIISDLETEIGFTMKNGKSLLDIVQEKKEDDGQLDLMMSDLPCESIAA